jgi:hypothetical protein
LNFEIIFIFYLFRDKQASCDVNGTENLNRLKPRYRRRKSDNNSKVRINKAAPEKSFYKRWMRESTRMNTSADAHLQFQSQISEQTVGTKDIAMPPTLILGQGLNVFIISDDPKLARHAEQGIIDYNGADAFEFGAVSRLLMDCCHLT